ncbi:hypothetical protein M885DRAFT_520921 [Pelagophyceae sp. CCMP2097]|nr:hypothetical protein M885DRAFT_520921 [Pelagophyceae sp. CCMP2097]|mmetsp:Transcript_25559/g.87795  ORF Transcript_25559/g.87795 Transcript_25559/m.87795 type:complete len:410 (-) Transcript_25559:80-1309(-)
MDASYGESHAVAFDESGHDFIAAPFSPPGGASDVRRALDVADSMVLEYVAFRGFAETFRSFAVEQADDAQRRGAFDANFCVEVLLRPVRALDAQALLEAWDFLDGRFFVRLDAELAAHADALRCGLYRYFCVHAIRKGHAAKATALLTELARRDSEDARGRAPVAVADALEPFEDDAYELPLWAPDDAAAERARRRSSEAQRRRAPGDARNGPRWREWFALPHVSEPHLDPLFEMYFGSPWRASFVTSLRNFLAAVFALAPPPKLLLLEKWHRSDAQRALRTELSAAQARGASLDGALRAAVGERDALAAAVRELLIHAHHESLRHATAGARLGQSGLFDDDPRDAVDEARKAGAAALDAAKAACDRPPPTPDDSDEQHHRNLEALVSATRAFTDHLKGSTAKAATEAP